MPIFECEQCHCVDNTALTSFWWDVFQENKAALCSQCDPNRGQWHYEFPRMSAEEYIAKCGPGSIKFPAGFDRAKGLNR